LGVQYGINQIIGNCSIRGIQSDDFGEDSQFTATYNQSGLGFAIRIRSPESFLDLDSVYIHTGKRTVNGIKSDVYISNRSDFKINTFYEYTFSEAKFSIVNNQINNNPIPVSLTINFYKVYYCILKYLVLFILK
jgi:hypothetical protein